MSDHSAKGLAEFADAAEFEAHYGVPRAEVEAGAVTLAMTGTKEVHPIETRYLKPIVHSLMDIDAYVIERRHCRSLALMVSEDRDTLRGTYVGRYLAWGEGKNFSKGATVVSRAKARNWYDLTNFRKAGNLWSKAHQYRHVSPLNPDFLPVNCNLYTVSAPNADQVVVAGVLNSSFVALSKTLYGRPAGVEGNLKTEIVDVDVMPVPDWQAGSPQVGARIADAMRRLMARPVLGMLSPRRLRRKTFEAQDRRGELAMLSDESELTQADRRALDDAVLELLGITNPRERARLTDALHAHLAQHFKAVRVKEEEAIENKAKAARQGAIGADEIVVDVMAEIERDHPALLRDFEAFFRDPSGDGLLVPAAGTPVVIDDLVTTGVRFTTGRAGELIKTHSRAQADLLAAIAAVGPRGRRLFVPRDPTVAGPLTKRMAELATERAATARRLVADRTADQDLQERALTLVLSRLLAGMSRPRRAAAIASAR